MSLDLPEGRVDYWDGHRWQRTDPAPLVAQAEDLVHLPESEFGQALKAFNASVGGHVLYPADDDFGAVVLEALADACTDAGRKQDLYAAAARRADGHAGGATSGGEGIARSMHTKRIIRKLAKKYERMRDGGKSAREVRACAAADGLNPGYIVSVLREVFDLTVEEALKVALERYEQMRASGKSAQEVGACAAADGLGRGDVTGVLREVFNLTAEEAHKVAHEIG